MNAQLALELFGTDEPVASPRLLRAGALSVCFDNGMLRELRWFGVEVVRAVSYLLRDRDWGTVPARLSALELQEDGSSFALRFALTIVTPDGTLEARARIEGDAGGRLLFEVLATPDADLPTNRCGFVVLHPAACAGQPLEIEHTDGAVEQTAFPALISPGQPAFAIRELRHSMPVVGGAAVQVRVRLEAQLPGDPAGKFEMEDQRNWSDASYKTYVASLLDPWPYLLPARRTLRQCVTVSVLGGEVASGPVGAHGGARETVVLSLAAAADARLPEIGVGVPSGLHKARAHELDALRALAAPWWVVEAVLDDEGLPRHLAAVALQRRACPGSVQLDVVAPEALDPRQAASLASQRCQDNGLTVDRKSVV